MDAISQTTLVQIMAWRRSGDKPLSEPMMVSLLKHIYVLRPQWVKKSLHLNAALVWNLISHIPSVPSSKVSHAINIHLISMKFKRSKLSNPKNTHTKNYIKPKRLSHKILIWTKMAITFGEECRCMNIWMMKCISTLMGWGWGVSFFN